MRKRDAVVPGGAELQNLAAVSGHAALVCRERELGISCSRDVAPPNCALLERLPHSFLQQLDDSNG